MESGLLAALLERVDLFLLLFARMLGLFMTAPIWSNRLVPVPMRVAIAFVVALLLSPLTPAPPWPASLLLLGALAVRELLVGMVIGFVATLLFAAIQFAGQLLDVGMGLSMMNVLDPMTNTQLPIIGNFLYILALLIFFTINGHHMLLQAIVDSYAIVPIGQAALGPPVSEALVAMAGNLFLIGLQIAAPVLAALFLTTVALGLLNRAVPQMNIFVVGMPVQLAVGLFMLIVVLPVYVAFLQGLFGGMASDIMALLRLLKG